ncbi:LytR C-terminal domain-containing protein [Flexivirga sp. ID2601S]|uniref:LytR C-terminal domain-containing protein n=1 Tax=Flexivirga aerilata TaxID=1656889 RepID=A0A849AFT3_9MICO|nr:LytR C-terminal domain-containing protein [Flexivirga aerilata]NNG38111.1 LytR C-terminal domain-containing protein [Flexivirga aerilata]
MGHSTRRAAVAATAIAIALPTFAACGGSGGNDKKAEAPSTCVPSPTPTMKIGLGTIYVNVWNAGGKDGLAATVAQQLGWRGLHVIDTGNDPEAGSAKPPTTAQIRFGPGGRQIALTLATQVKDAQLVQDNRTNPTVDLVLGNKFALIPMPPTAASAVTVNVYNAYVLPGTAGTLAAEMRKRGFKVGQVGNDPKSGFYPDNATAIRYGSQGEPDARRVKLQVKDAKMINDGRKGTTVDLVIGSKWKDDTVVPVAQATVPPTPSPTSSPGC